MALWKMSRLKSKDSDLFRLDYSCCTLGCNKSIHNGHSAPPIGETSVGPRCLSIRGCMDTLVAPLMYPLHNPFRLVKSHNFNKSFGIRMESPFTQSNVNDKSITPHFYI